MSAELDPDVIATALLTSVGVLLRRGRLTRVEGELTMPERTALSLLDSTGPTTSSALARQEQITAQAMGATLSGLQARGLVVRSPAPQHGGRVFRALTDAGRQSLTDKRSARTQQVARALADGFTPEELERLAAV